MNIKKLRKEFENCACGEKHECSINEIVIGSGITAKVGETLLRNGFGKRLLLVADETTLRVSEGILQSLASFHVDKMVYKTFRVPDMKSVNDVQERLKNNDGVISIGTGSLNDIARLAAARKNKPLAIFATASSMDVFASYNAPIVENGFKITYPAKSPEVIFGDTKILAAAPVGLKSAGFGDMVAKYIGYIDWEVANLITGEALCSKVEQLSRSAADAIMKVADRVTASDQEAAGIIFECLLLTGIAMSFVKTARPAAGTEHTLAHFIECVELADDITPNYHGKDVGVMSLIVMRYYEALIKAQPIGFKKENLDLDKVCALCPELAGDIRKNNTPDTITDYIDEKLVFDSWGKIEEIIKSVPSSAQLEAAMIQAGCATTIAEIGKSYELTERAFLYHPYMRRRTSLLRFSKLLEFKYPEELDLTKIIR